MTITGVKVLTKRGKTKDDTEYLLLTLTDGETVDVLRTNDTSAMKAIEGIPLGEQVTVCITQSVYKDVIYNKITGIIV